MTLTEIVFSIALVSMLLLILFNIVPGSLLATSKAQQRLQATALAQALIEANRSTPIDHMQTGPQVLTPQVVNGVTFTRSLDIEPHVTPSPVVMRLSATVTWEDRGETQVVNQFLDVGQVKK